VLLLEAEQARGGVERREVAPLEFSTRPSRPISSSVTSSFLVGGLGSADGRDRHVPHERPPRGWQYALAHAPQPLRRGANELFISLPASVAALQQAGEEFSERVEPAELLDPGSAAVWGGQMLPDSLPLFDNDAGDRILARFAMDGSIREFVEWRHEGSGCGRQISSPATSPRSHRCNWRGERAPLRFAGLL